MASAFISVAAVLLAWQLFLWLFHLNHFIGKGPLDVWNYMVTDHGAAANRSTLLAESGVTIRDALLGLVSGTVLGVAAAVAFVIWSPVEQAVMPVAMTLRAVPLVAMTPLIVLMFGRDLSAVSVIAGIVTFFPTLVNVAVALRATSKESTDLCRAYGASAAMTLRKVQLPAAVPALMSSLRIAAPLALVGAMLAEWLATGKGLGYQIVSAAAQSDYSGLWSRVALATGFSLILYALIAAAERRVLHRFGTTA
jgi:ABC-type nitrate/sulfonate/bicarbonate transport system permease component